MLYLVIEKYSTIWGYDASWDPLPTALKGDLANKRQKPTILLQPSKFPFQSSTNANFNSQVV